MPKLAKLTNRSASVATLRPLAGTSIKASEKNITDMDGVASNTQSVSAIGLTAARDTDRIDLKNEYNTIDPSTLQLAAELNQESIENDKRNESSKISPKTSTKKSNATSKKSAPKPPSINQQSVNKDSGLGDDEYQMADKKVEDVKQVVESSSIVDDKKSDAAKIGDDKKVEDKIQDKVEEKADEKDLVKVDDKESDEDYDDGFSEEKKDG